ncbi:hypothetical protein [Promicromonospora soli]
MDNEPIDLEGLGIVTEPKHPRFAVHFTDPIYDDPANDFAPFGNDEGADILADWATRVGELDEASTVRTILEDLFDEGSGDVAAIEDGDVDTAMFAVGAAFTLLRLAGRIDHEGTLLALRGLDVIEGFYTSVPEVERMRSDLIAFTERSAVAPSQPK